VDHVALLRVSHEDKDQHAGTIAAFVYVQDASQSQIRHVQPCLFAYLAPGG
jgi:hypothetical protein